MCGEGSRRGRLDSTRRSCGRTTERVVNRVCSAAIDGLISVEDAAFIIGRSGAAAIEDVVPVLASIATLLVMLAAGPLLKRGSIIPSSSE